MNAIAQTQFNPSLAVINGTIKTTSLKVAEHFGKRHDNVIRAIKSLDCSPEYHALNFEEMLIDIEIGNGAIKKSPAYEMTKDGFTFLAMGFTGKEAAKWKEAYINAFNAMAIQLSANPLQLPEAKTKKAIAGGLTLDQQDTIKALVKSRAQGLPKDKQAGAIIKQWSAIKKKYGMSYKEVAPENFVNIISLITRLPIEGELVENPEPIQQNSITINLAPLVDGKLRRWLVSQVAAEAGMFHPINPDQLIQSKAQFMDDLIEEGYIVIKRDELLGRLQA